MANFVMVLEREADTTHADREREREGERRRGREGGDKARVLDASINLFYYLESEWGSDEALLGLGNVDEDSRNPNLTSQSWRPHFKPPPMTIT